MAEARILLVEDDRSLGQRLRKGLGQAGYAVHLAVDGQSALEALRAEAFDIAVLDWMLPDIDGIEVLRTLRAEGRRLPVIFLTARGEVDDRVDGLDAGADDYMTKPFALAELCARVRTLLRRGSATRERILEIGKLRIDLMANRVEVGGTPLDLTPREYSLLAFLALRQGDAVSRTTLTREVWQAENRFTSLDNVIDVHMANLRKKLRAACGHDPITTLRGVGYRMEAAGSEG
ncbi:MAG: response regulator transcription factor [Opitutales bacterium]|nr:response regulator transcription factor [Opitutales bacterium]